MGLNWGAFKHIRSCSVGLLRKTQSAKKDEFHELGLNWVCFSPDNAFRAINDNLGHAEGDRVLKDIAAHLLKSTRASDVVCRSGGDEFAVILPDTSRDTGIMIANRISLGTPEYIMTSPKNGLSTPVHLSIGLATFPVDTDDRDGLIEYADKALYRDKDEFYASRERDEHPGIK